MSLQRIFSAPPSSARRRWIFTIALLSALTGASVFSTGLVQAKGDWPTTGQYRFDRWAGPSLGVEFYVPEQAGLESPILIVMPGARRTAGDYRDLWGQLAETNDFIVLALDCSLQGFPSEYEYDAGGVVNERGELQPRSTRLFAAIEPLFDDFRERFGSRRKSYSLYGHSAGAGFVERFPLFVPNARVDRLVAANPAFSTMPVDGVRYPFGLMGLEVSQEDLDRWLASRLVILLGEKDLGPLSQPLSNDPQANAQGQNVLARGRALHRAGALAAERRGAEYRWDLVLVPGVGHSNDHIASHAVPFLFRD